MSTIIFGPTFDDASLLKGKGNTFVLLTDSNVEPLIAIPLLHKLKKKGFKTILISFDAGEEQKTRATKEWIENEMLAQKCGRDTCLLAVGGGVVTDLGGFVASTYCRGIPFFSIPTTLLGMVDAALGGKTGINVPEGKNMIGSFYHPEAILIDPSYLLSLPEKEMRNGLAEVIKHALIADRDLFIELESSPERWLERDLLFLEAMIRKNCSIKGQIVSMDPREKGVRRILNFGHTLGHAIEFSENYTLSHGEAVAMGISLEAELSLALGHLSQEELQRIQTLLIRYGFSLKNFKEIYSDPLVSALSLDKKAVFAVPRFVALKTIGEAMSFDGAYCTSLHKGLLDAFAVR